MRILSRLAILLAACAAGLTAQSLSKQLPPPFQTPSADNRSQIVPQPAGARIKVPAGFTVDVAADGFDTPRFMLLGPGNEILMSDSGGSRENGVSPDSGDVWGRPVGLLQLPGGSLLLTDDGGKKIWRVAYKASQSSTAAEVK